MARLGFMAFLVGISLCLTPTSAAPGGLVGALVESDDTEDDTAGALQNIVSTVSNTVESGVESVTSLTKLLNETFDGVMAALADGVEVIEEDRTFLETETQKGLDTATQCLVTFVGSNSYALSSMSEGCQLNKHLTDGERTMCNRELMGRLDNLMSTVQSILWDLLAMLGFEYQPSKAANHLLIPLCTPVLEALLKRLPIVESVIRNLEFRQVKGELASESADNSEDGAWGTSKIQAESVWNNNNTGQGIRVATLDSGVLGTHDALKDNFLGNRYTGYGWYDALDKHQSFFDDVGHGTHTMATLAGRHGFGTAPGAEWMSCRFCNSTRCYWPELQVCANWILEPTTANGKTPNSDLAPHVVSNSWYMLQNHPYFDAYLAAWEAARIIPVFAAGNTGRSGCKTVMSPADREKAIAVGATDKNDALSLFSARGPSNNRIKPDCTAPGEGILSAWIGSNSATKSMSGTSMATPMVAGTCALMKHVNPGLTLSDVFDFLSDGTADEATSGTNTCDDSMDELKNNEVGYGRINAYNIVDAVPKKTANT